MCKATIVLVRLVRHCYYDGLSTFETTSKCWRPECATLLRGIAIWPMFQQAVTGIVNIILIPTGHPFKPEQRD